MKSWKTTLAGIAGLLIGAGTAIKLAMAGEVSGAVAAGTGVVSSIGLLFARDNNVTSEKAGAK